MRSRALLLAVALALAAVVTWWLTRDAGVDEGVPVERSARTAGVHEARTEDPRLAGAPAKVPLPTRAVEETDDVPEVAELRRVLSGRIVDAHRAPIRFAVAWLDVVREAPSPLDQAVSDEDGAFRLRIDPAVPAGEHLFCAKCADHRCAYFRLVIPDHEFEQDLGDVVLREGDVIRGRVTDGSGAPLEHMRVRAVVEDGPAVAFGYPGGVLELGMAASLTNADGEFVLRGLGPVAHVVRVDLLMFWARRSEPERIAGVKPNDPPLRFVVRSVAVVRGRVVDAATNRAIPVFVVNGTRFESQDGRFEIDLPENRALYVESKGYRPSGIEGLQPGGDRAGKTLDVRLMTDPEIGSLRIVVRDPAGTPLTGWTAVTLDDAYLEWRTEAGDRCEVVVDGLRAGPLGVLVWTEGLSLVLAKTEIHVGQEQTVEVTLHRGGAVRFEILDEDGAAPTNVDITVLDREERPVLARWTYDEPQGDLLQTTEEHIHGQYYMARLEGRLDGLAAGRYILRIHRAIGHRDVEFEVPESGTADVKARLGGKPDR